MKTDLKEWPHHVWLDKPPLTRLVASIIAQEVADNRGTDLQRLRPDQWDDGTALIDAGLALDSLERTNCAAALNEAFHLSEFGAEDYLLACETLGEWVHIVALSIANGPGQITFHTSGSTGAPKAVTHSVAQLLAEVDFWSERFVARQRIVSLVPPHHIFGLIFTVMLPQRMEVPLIDARYTGVGALKDALHEPGTLVVGAPVHWQYLARSILRFPPDVEGIASTAPMPHQLAQQLHAQRLETLTQIYGSTETGGVGYRVSHADPYTLLPVWRLVEEGDDLLLVYRRDGTRQELMDHIERGENDTFIVTGRRDGAVQVGGTNVFPIRVAEALDGQVDVKSCSVRFCTTRQRLVAFVVPEDDGADIGLLEDTLRAYCMQQFPAAACPAAYSFGSALPRNEMGKAVAW
ncbi:MAG: AMP-binding protein [Pseudomonadota bacterium]